MPATTCPVQELQSKSAHEFAASICDAQRRQPWKAHWPPKSTPTTDRYTFEKGQTIIIDGN